ncbi:MAG: Transcriptional repressor PagR [Planctomycetes bacterium ADurb.Bin126]|nr:MAG: Transcriptional repressor PagR [Planctomycetes bacterium ADurb.Bin126]HOD83398.1 metalloregulator ArsR/SmtB family transcription factor [Phycisphaerae bacterium]HQL74186.1 metalloregulator ArsR/SmtB family transcription factor [Phycisphaerae bacterium]
MMEDEGSTTRGDDTTRESPLPELDLVPMGTLCRAAECLKVMAHPQRLQIVDILMESQARQTEMTVNQIARLCGLPPHQACEHLRLLKGYNLLDSERRGRTVIYRIVDPRLPGLLTCIRRCCDIRNPQTS